MTRRGFPSFGRLAQQPKIEKTDKVGKNGKKSSVFS